MINPTYPGVYVQEKASGARAIAGVATSITAFVGTTRRGQHNSPTRIFNLREYERKFGAGDNSSFMEEQVKLFFDNGGSEAWITRIAKGAEAASVTIRNEDEVDVLKFIALEKGVDGNNLRVEVDYNTLHPEATFNVRVYRRVTNTNGTVSIEDIENYSNLSMDPDDGKYAVTSINNLSSLVEVEDLVSGSGAMDASHSISGLILPDVEGQLVATVEDKFSSNPTGQFILKVDNNAPVTIVVPLPASSAALLTNISDAISTGLGSLGLSNTVDCVYESGITDGRVIHISIADARISISPAASNDIAVPLMLGASQGGLEISRFANLRPAPSCYVARPYTISGNAPELSGLMTLLDTEKGNLTGFELTDSSSFTPHSFSPFVYSTPGHLYEGTQFVPSVNSLGALVNLKENLNTIASAITNNTNQQWEAEVHGFRLILKPLFGMENAGVNASLTTSTDDIAAAGNVFDAALTPQNTQSYMLGKAVGDIGAYQWDHFEGKDGQIPDEQDYRDAFSVIEKEVDLFNLMVLPRAEGTDGTQSDSQRKSAFNIASSFCAKKRAFLLVDPPSDSGPNKWTDSSNTSTGVDALRIGLETRNSAVYWPRLKKANGSFQDPSGAMAGLISRTDSSRGVWKAPAGVEATLRGVSGVEYPMSDPDNGVINPKAVNALRVFPDGVLSWGARTLIGFNDSGNIDDKYIPVRRTMLYIEESLYRGLRFAVFEPNDEPLWSQIRLAAGSFMNTLFRQGAFAGKKASDAYYVLCDATTTTETDKNLGIVNVVVGFAPVKPAEFVVLTVTQIAGQIQT